MSTITQEPSNTATVARRGRPRRQYRCEHCAKSFKRSEHCIRHVRTHTQEKPFVCRYCRKSYSRKLVSDAFFHFLIYPVPYYLLYYLHARLTKLFSTVDRDLVTRHERTLHADVHEQAPSRQQRRRDKNQQEHQQDRGHTLDQVNVASFEPSQPSALEIPPGEDSEACLEPDEPRDTPITAFLEQSASQKDEVTFSPSTSASSPSSNLVAEQGDGTSWSSASVVAHDDCGREKPTPNCDSNITIITEAPSEQSITRMVATFAGGEAGLERLQNDHHARNVSTSAEHMSFDTAGHAGTFDLMDLDTSMSMTLGLDSTMPKAVPDGEHNQQRLLNALMHPTYSQNEALAPYYFPMPSIDLDFSAFSFSPTSTQLDAMDRNHSSFHLETGAAFQGPSNADFDPIVDAEPMSPPTARDSRAAATASHYPASPKDTSESRTKSNDIPYLLVDKPQTSFVLSLDESGRAQLCHDLGRRLDVLDTNGDVPSVKICQGFLSSYVTSFHGHLPIIHLPSFCVSRTPSPLILAMCSIGALYRLDRRRARQYYDLALRAVATVSSPASASFDEVRLEITFADLWLTLFGP